MPTRTAVADPERRGSWLFTLWVAGCLLVTMPAASLAVLLLPDRAAVDRLVRRWSRLVVRLSRCRVTVEGLEHAQTNAIFVSNHASYLDSILFLAVLPLEFRFVAHHEAVSWPLVGRALRKSGHIV